MHAFYAYEELNRNFGTQWTDRSSTVKQRGGCRQHLVEALVEAAAGPVPPSALLPMLCARESGPSVGDLALEILERVAAGNGYNSFDGDGTGAPKKAILGTVHSKNRTSDPSGRRGRRG